MSDEWDTAKLKSDTNQTANAAAASNEQFIGVILMGLGILCFFGPLFLGVGGAIPHGIAGAIGAGFIVAGSRIRNRGRKRIAPMAQTALGEDTRPPVVYLRSFQDDAIAGQTVLPGSWVILNTTTEEEQISTTLKAIGPVIAIGQPGEKLPELGAARMYVDDAEWQDAVLDLLVRARLVVLRAGQTSGFWWEVEKAAQMVDPQRLLFLIPRGKTQYDAFRQKANEFLPHPLPEHVPGVDSHQFFGSLRGLIYFQADWTSHYVPIQTGSGKTLSPIVPALTKALEPVFQQLQIPFQHPR
jgi:hypothetical protein